MSIFKKKNPGETEETVAVTEVAAEPEAKKKGKKAKVLVPLALILVAFICIALAFLTSHNSKTNTMTIGSIKVNLYELFDANYDMKISTDEVYGPETANPPALLSLPQQETIKTPYLTNSGKNDAYVYLKVGVPAAVVDGEEKDLFVFIDSEGNEGINDGWHLASDDVERVVDEETGLITNYYLYYYDTALEPNTNSKPLFDKVKMIDYEDSTICKITDVFDGYAYLEETGGADAEGWHRLTSARTLDELKNAVFYVDGRFVMWGKKEHYIYNQADPEFDHETYSHYILANKLMEQYCVPEVEDKFGDSDVDIIGFFNPMYFSVSKIADGDTIGFIVNLKEDYTSSDGTVYEAGLYSYNFIPYGIDFCEYTSLDGSELEMPINSYAIQTAGIDFTDPYEIYNTFFVEGEEYNPDDSEEETGETGEKADSLTTKTISESTNLSNVSMIQVESDNDYNKYYVKVSDDTSAWFVDNTVTTLGSVDDMETALGINVITSTTMGTRDNTKLGAVNSLLLEADVLSGNAGIFGTTSSGSKKYYTMKDTPYYDISCLDSSGFRNSRETNALHVVTTAYTDSSTGYTWQTGVYIPVWQDSDGNYYHYDYKFPSSVTLSKAYSCTYTNGEYVFNVNGKEYDGEETEIGSYTFYDITGSGLAETIDDIKEMYFYQNAADIEDGVLGYVYNKIKISDLLKLQEAFEEDYSNGTYASEVANTDSFYAYDESVCAWKNWVRYNLLTDSSYLTSAYNYPVVITSENADLYDISSYLIDGLDSSLGKNGWIYLSAVNILFVKNDVTNYTLMDMPVSETYTVDKDGNKTTDESAAAGNVYKTSMYGEEITVTIIDGVMAAYEVNYSGGSMSIITYKDTSEHKDVFLYNGVEMGSSEIGFYEGQYAIQEDENGLLYYENERGNINYMTGDSGSIDMSINDDGTYDYTDDDGETTVITLAEAKEQLSLMYLNDSGEIVYKDSDGNIQSGEDSGEIADYNYIATNFKPMEKTIGAGIYVWTNQYVELYKEGN